MSKFYAEPKIEFRMYRIAQDVFTDSDPGLEDGDEFDLDAIGRPDDVFAD